MTIRNYRSQAAVLRPGRARKRSLERLETRVLLAADLAIGPYVVLPETGTFDAQPEHVAPMASHADAPIQTQIEAAVETCDGVDLDAGLAGEQPPSTGSCELDGQDPEHEDGQFELQLDETSPSSPDADPPPQRHLAQDVQASQSATGQPSDSLIAPSASAGKSFTPIAENRVTPLAQHSSSVADSFQYFRDVDENSEAERRGLASRPSAADLRHDSFVAMTLMTPRSLPTLEQEPQHQAASAKHAPHPDFEVTARATSRLSTTACQAHVVDQAFQQWDNATELESTLLDPQTDAAESGVGSQPQGASNDMEAHSALLGKAAFNATEHPVMSEANRVPTPVSMAALALVSTFVTSRDRRRGEHRAAPLTLRLQALEWLGNSLARLARIRFSSGRSV